MISGALYLPGGETIHKPGQEHWECVLVERI